ncbi:hypothetical protein LJR290_005354 [Variovorax sp. LjRoot290]|uniref:hypothetical protein n=2 Tax=unclassified Variovorax TaxID=663243 RepID=UPI003ECF818C
MKATPGARSWMAAGVRHELLTRVFPALRHDLASPVSVIRMAMLMFKRQATVKPVDTAAWQERVALVEGQVGALATGVRSLRDWELAVSDEGVTRSALVAQCTGLMRAAFELNGIRLHVGEGLAPGEGEQRFPAGAALRYMCLGVLSYLQDGAPQLGAVHIEPEGRDIVRFSATRGAAELAELADPHRAPRKLAIDAVALQLLAEDLGYFVALDGDTVRLSLVRRSNQ